MYARRVDGRELTFGVSGNLWRDALVMYDRETNSLWSHVTGECIEGKLLGKRVTPLAAILVPFREWAERYPDSKVLVRSERGQTRSRYSSYVESDRLGIFGTQAKREELPPKEIVQGVAFENASAAIVVAALESGETTEFTLAGQDFVARKEGSAVRVFRRLADGRLEPHPTTTAFWFGWVNFYPRAVVIP